MKYSIDISWDGTVRLMIRTLRGERYVSHAIHYHLPINRLVRGCFARHIPREAVLQIKEGLKKVKADDNTDGYHWHNYYSIPLNIRVWTK